jgi:3-oxoacyl-[acyl-carrier-protein] synthase-1/3-oxoacyl-[acyl-carrier-protein] synthase II
MLQRIPVITGTGIISAAGCGIGRVWESISTGQSGLGPLTLFSSPRYAHHPVGQVREDVDALAGRVRGSRSDKLAWIAAREALAAAGLESGPDALNPERMGVMLGCTVGGMLSTEQVLTCLLRGLKRRFGPLRFHECAGGTDLCARKLGALGPCATVSTACSAGAMAILAAAELIEQGEADLMLAGGTDSLSRLTLNGFGSLLLLDPEGCRPFDARRAGISLGEGAAMLVLEAEESARARGAPVLARLAGWGASCDAFHATAPHPEGRGACAAIQSAFERGSIQPADIDYVSAHGTGTPDNDAMEIRALKQIFGDRLPPVASAQRFFGHTLAASGAIKAVLAVQSLREQAVPGTPGFEVADDKLGLEPVKEFRAQSVSRILSNSFGFGGNNVALVFAVPVISNPKSQIPNPSQSLLASAATKRGFAILGVGAVSAAGNSLAEIATAFRNGGAVASWFDVPAASPPGKARVYACGAFGAEQFIEPAKRRKLSRIQQMVLVAARKSFNCAAAAVAPEKICVAIGTGLGSLNDTAAFVENMILKEERAPRPIFFTSSVHNSLAAQIAIELNFSGLNSTPVQREISFETALWQGTTELALGQADIALLGAADELNQYHLAAGMRWGWWRESSPEIQPFAGALKNRERPLPGEGGAVVTLGRAENAVSPLAFVSAIRIGRSENQNAGAEARWILRTLERDGIAAGDVDLLLTGANGSAKPDDFYRAVAGALSRLAGRNIACGAYKHACGEHHSAPAFGFLTAVGLVRGEIAPGFCTVDKTVLPGACRTVVLFTFSTTGTKGMCCIRA